LDATDEKILELLKGNSRMPFLEIAKKLGISEGSVRRRVKKMVESGTIARFTIEVRRGGVKALTLIVIDPNVPTERVVDSLSKVGGAQVIYEITGEYDAATVIAADSITQVNKSIEEIRRIPGVMKTYTTIILREVH
jgi:DNA-binding Lrp family transcriptional regulator